MPKKFDDENDENRNIQHVKINKPDFNVKEPTSSKTLTTIEDDRRAILSTENGASQRAKALRSAGTSKPTILREQSNKASFKEPTSPTDSKLGKKLNVDFKHTSSHLEGFKTDYQKEQLKEQILK
jgi:hypothetical protein